MHTTKNSKQLLIYYNYSEGIGDTLISLYDIVAFSIYLKTYLPEIEVNLIINNVRGGNNIEYMLDLAMFRSYFHSVDILKGAQLVSIESTGNIVYNSTRYRRLFSCNNDNIESSIPGCFDIYSTEENIEYFTSLNLPYRDFIFTLDSRDLPDYGILNKDIVNDVNAFVSSSFTSPFEAIYYREFKDVDFKQVNEFIEKLLPILDKSKTYFFCSNHVEVKKIFDNLGYNLKYFRPIDKHPIDRVPNGYSGVRADMYYALGDMLVLGYSKRVYTGISRNWPSLFNFYASSVKNVPIVYIQTS